MQTVNFSLAAREAAAEEGSASSQEQFATAQKQSSHRSLVDIGEMHLKWSRSSYGLLSGEK